MKRNVVIIGGSAAGITAALTARRHYPDAKITLIRKEEKVPIPCGIPYIFGTLGSPEKNLMPEDPLIKNDIELIIDEVVSIDRSSKAVKTKGGREIGYDKLILATGSVPIVPPIPGVELGNVFTIKKDVNYLARILEALGEARDVVIIGGGFIGMEIADECCKRGNLNVTVVEMLPHCLALVFEDELCVAAEEELSKRGARIRTGEKAKAIVGDGKVEYVELESGEKVKADVVILAIGVRPNAELAKEAGLELGPLGGVAVDRYMRTTDPDIFAVGDCAEKFDFFTGKPSPLRLASIATAEARIAGANLFELRRENKGVVGVFSTKIGDVALGLAGIDERRAREAGIDFVVGVSESVDRHPGGMPGATPTKVKLVFRRYSGAIIGGCVRGGEGAGEMVNLISAMIQSGMHADQIALFQMGTHPALTASPVAYQIVNAAEIALSQMR